MNDTERDQNRVKAHSLMEEALGILDKTGDNHAAALLEHAIAILGMRTSDTTKKLLADES
jgi:hypothetical protein